jgi:hypothetical protein
MIVVCVVRSYDGRIMSVLKKGALLCWNIDKVRSKDVDGGYGLVNGREEYNNYCQRLRWI